MTDEYLSPTSYCDYTHNEIVRLSNSLLKGVIDDRERAVILFTWVRDHIYYRVGLWQRRASETLLERRGTCTNKSNLLVALLRLNNIKAGYGVLRTKGRDYIGPIVIPSLRRRIGAVSTHVYTYVFLSGKWLKCDPSADSQISLNTAHFNRQSKLVIWDGYEDAVEDLDPEHIISDNGPLSDIDHIIRKKSKNGKGVTIKLANLYIDFLRKFKFDKVNSDLLEDKFKEWLIKEKRAYLSFIIFKVSSCIKGIYENMNYNFWSRYMTVYDVIGRAIPYQLLVEEIIRIGQFRKKDIILDAGSGTGLISIAVKRQSGSRVISFDNSSTAINIHKEKDSCAEIIIGDLHSKLPFPNSHFDKVICALTLHVFSPYDRSLIVKEFFRVLKPGGMILLISPVRGFSTIGILYNHIVSSISRYGLLYTLIDVIRSSMSVVKMLYFNFMLKFGVGAYPYLDFNEHNTYLEQNNFKKIFDTSFVYANNAIMTRAIK